MRNEGVVQLAKELGCSKSYVSKIMSGKKKPSKKMAALLQEVNSRVDSEHGRAYFKSVDGHSNVHGGFDTHSLPPAPQVDQKLTESFLQSRRDGLSPETLKFYRGYLHLSKSVIGPSVSGQQVKVFLDSRPCSMAGKHAYYRVLRAFYNWLYSPRSGMKLNPWDNPMKWVDAPKLAKRILPSLTREEVMQLVEIVDNARDKAIISLFAESGLRLSELANIMARDIDWRNRTIRVVGKGNKEALAPFGQQSEAYLKAWLAEFNPNGCTVWGINRWQIVVIMRNLKAKTGLPCNPHTFRRTFACLLRKAGIDTMTIKDLGRWESLEMVQRYTRSVTFEDSLRFYKAPLS